MRTVVASFQHRTIPALKIAIVKTTGTKGQDLYLITREGGRSFNYLSCGRPTEVEAREVANFLWTDAVRRTRAHQAETVCRERDAQAANQPDPFSDPAPVAPEAPAAAPEPVEVPAGRYALESGPGGAIRFFKIDRPTEGRWAGYVFVKVLASDEEFPIRSRAGREQVLAEIAADVQAASERYGREIGSCGVCGRTLTDEASRAAGIGPKCAAKMGW